MIATTLSESGLPTAVVVLVGVAVGLLRGWSG